MDDLFTRPSPRSVTPPPPAESYVVISIVQNIIVSNCCWCHDSWSSFCLLSFDSPKHLCYHRFYCRHHHRCMQFMTIFIPILCLWTFCLMYTRVMYNLALYFQALTSIEDLLLTPKLECYCWCGDISNAAIAIIIILVNIISLIANIMVFVIFIIIISSCISSSLLDSQSKNCIY